MTREEVLHRARQAVADRGLNYGKPEDNFARIAARWTVHLHNCGLLSADQKLDAQNVALMMIDLKIARLENQHHEDSWVDIAGYAACGSEVGDKNNDDTGP